MLAATLRFRAQNTSNNKVRWMGRCESSLNRPVTGDWVNEEGTEYENGFLAGGRDLTSKPQAPVRGQHAMRRERKDLPGVSLTGYSSKVRRLSIVLITARIPITTQ